MDRIINETILYFDGFNFILSLLKHIKKWNNICFLIYVTN